MKTFSASRALSLLSLGAIALGTLVVVDTSEAKPRRSSSRSSSSFGSSRSSSSSSSYGSRSTTRSSTSNNSSSSSSGGLFGGWFGRRSNSTPSTPSTPPSPRVPTSSPSVSRPPVRRIVPVPVRRTTPIRRATSYTTGRRPNRYSYTERHLTGLVLENKPGTVFTLRTAGNRTLEVSGAIKPQGFSRGDEVAVQGRPRNGLLSSNRYQANTIRIIRNQ